MSKVLFHPLTAVLFTILAVIVSISFLLSANQLKKVDKTLETAQAETQKVRDDFAQVASQAALAQEDFAKERIIRNQLLMQKPGEVVVQLPDVNEVTVESVPEEKRLSPLEAWRKLLF